MHNPQPAALHGQFREAMRHLASTVSIVSCADGQDGEDWFGMTATSVTPVSMEPASLLVCVNEMASIHAVLLARRRFCINLLSADQRDVAQAFAGQMKRADRFKIGNWRSANQQPPALQQAQANIFCTLAETLRHGTHSIFLGLVQGIQVAQQNAPLVYHNGQYVAAAQPLYDAA